MALPSSDSPLLRPLSLPVASPGEAGPSRGALAPSDPRELRRDVLRAGETAALQPQRPTRCCELGHPGNSQLGIVIFCQDAYQTQLLQFSLVVFFGCSGILLKSLGRCRGQQLLSVTQHQARGRAAVVGLSPPWHPQRQTPSSTAVSRLKMPQPWCAARWDPRGKTRGRWASPSPRPLGLGSWHHTELGQRCTAQGWGKAAAPGACIRLGVSVSWVLKIKEKPTKNQARRQLWLRLRIRETGTSMRDRVEAARAAGKLWLWLEAPLLAAACGPALRWPWGCGRAGSGSLPKILLQNTGSRRAGAGDAGAGQGWLGRAGTPQPGTATEPAGPLRAKPLAWPACSGSGQQSSAGIPTGATQATPPEKLKHPHQSSSDISTGAARASLASERCPQGRKVGQGRGRGCGLGGAVRGQPDPQAALRHAASLPPAPHRLPLPQQGKGKGG